MIALRILEQVWCTICPPLAPSCGVNQKASTFPWPLADGWQLAIGSGSGLLGAITVHNLNTGMLASRPGRGRRRASQPSQVTQKTALNMADKAGRRIGQAASRDMILQARRSMHENSWLDYWNPTDMGVGSVSCVQAPCLDVIAHCFARSRVLCNHPENRGAGAAGNNKMKRTGDCSTTTVMLDDNRWDPIPACRHLHDGRI